jgi:NADH pyrophosphatase NudC (nudix superfamily)
VQASESLEEAVRREVREATGLDVDHVRYEESRVSAGPGTLTVAFRARVTSESVRLASGSRELRWFTRAEVHERLGATPDAPGEAGAEPIEDALLRAWAWDAS